MTLPIAKARPWDQFHCLTEGCTDDTGIVIYVFTWQPGRPVPPVEQPPTDVPMGAGGIHPPNAPGILPGQMHGVLGWCCFACKPDFAGLTPEEVMAVFGIRWEDTYSQVFNKRRKWWVDPPPENRRIWFRYRGGQRLWLPHNADPVPLPPP